MTEPSSLLPLLDEHYQATQAYANAQTGLLNAVLDTTTPQPQRSDALQKASTSLCDKREVLRSIFSKLQAHPELLLRHKSHIGVSRRVMQTISRNPSWNQFDLPSHTTGILEINTVALASLNASIARIKEVVDV